MRFLIKGEKSVSSLARRDQGKIDFVKTYVRQKFLKFGKLVPAASLLEITLDTKKEGRKKQVSVNLDIPGVKKMLHINEDSSDWETAVNLAEGRLDEAVRRLKEKRVGFFKKIGKGLLTKFNKPQ